jgi:hypothetical protein
VSLLDKIRGAIEQQLDAQIARDARQHVGNQVLQKTLEQETLQKSEQLEKKEYQDGSIGRKGLMIDPFFGQEVSAGAYRFRRGGVGNLMLKMATRQNACVSTIIETRAGQVASFCKKQENHYDIGFKFEPRTQDMVTDPNETEELNDFILNCGHKEGRNPDDKMTFDQWGGWVTRDMLRYGYFTVERDWTREGLLYSFLPLDAGTIFYRNDNLSDETLRQEAQQWQTSIKAEKPNFEPNDPNAEDQETPIRYVQIINQRDVANFTQKELIFSVLNLQGDVDLQGYAISPLERAIYMVANHQKIEHHQSSFFTHGMASRGVFIIQGDVTPNNLSLLQKQWSQQVSGSSNSWRTPILAGIQGAQWIPLQPTNRDMEYAAYQDHVLRTIHSAFLIDPEETGYGYLSKGTEQRSLGESSNEWRVEASRDKGLRPILTRIEGLINEEVLPNSHPELAQKYRFRFVGLDAESKVEETQRLQGDVQLHTTVNEARQQAEKDLLPVAGNLILNPTFIQTAMQSMPFGMWCELFMGLKGASKRPDLQFFANPSWFQWQQFQMQVMQQAAMAEADQDDDDRPKKKSKKNDVKKSENVEPDAEDEEEMERQQAALAQAAVSYMKANPDLFKSVEENLAKSKAVHRAIAPMEQHAIRQYRQASSKMIEEILRAVAAETKTPKGDA